MKALHKFPLYLGLFSLVVSLLVSAVRIGENRSVTTTQTKASLVISGLQLYFNSPNLITVIVSSDTEIAGIDVTLKFDPDKIRILPSTLTSSNFIATGGIVSAENNDFSFTLTQPLIPIKSGIIASFEVEPNKNFASETQIQFVTTDDKTGIYTNDSIINILRDTKGVIFKI